MNIRKPIDYTAMFASLDELIAADIPQIKLYYEIGRLVSANPEKGAAVAAAEYLRTAYSDSAGFSPRNLRRMREFYRAYGDTPETIDAAMKIGWTQNVVILEAKLTIPEKAWYLRAVRHFSWSKAELLRQIEAEAHLTLDLADEVCYTKENVAGEGSNHAKTEDHQRHGTGSPGAADGISAVLSLFHPQLFH